MTLDLITLIFSRIFMIFIGVYILIKVRNIDTKYDNSSVIGDKIDYSKNLLELIDELITIELLHYNRHQIFLDSSDKPITKDIDVALETVSNTVFMSLRAEIYDDKDIVFNRNYLLSYIQKRTFIIIMKYVQENVASQI